MKYSWKVSSFDTEILALKTATITHADLHYISDLKKDLKKEGIEYATYRVSADDYPMIQALEENNFILVDGITTLEKMLDTEFVHLPFVKTATQKDEKQLINMSGSIFRGVSRYYHDPIISTKKGDNIYKQWMKNSLNGTVADVVLTWKEKNEILGFVTLQKKGHIPLIAVAENARGKGVGKGLLQAAFKTFVMWGLTTAVIETQLANIPALRLYQSCGFKIIKSSLTFRWHNDS